jgi:transcription elongation factor GreA
MPDETQITAKGLEDLKAELDQLENVQRREVSERIGIARDFGDLKENSEYHDAKNEAALLELKISRLRERLTTAVVVDGDQVGAGAQFGSQVTLRDEQTSDETTYKIVGPTEANLAEGRLSIESPVAQAVIGRSAGDTAIVVTPRGHRKFVVVDVS